MTITNPNLDPHYQFRILEIEKEIDSNQVPVSDSVVLLGDSITEANPAVTFAGRPVFNMGISGDQVDAPDRGLLRRVYHVAQVAPEHLFLLIGINDLASGKHPDLLLQQLAQVIRALAAVSSATNLHIQSILPTRDSYAHLNPMICGVNEKIEIHCRESRIQFLNLWPMMADSEGILKSEFTDDGVHLLPPAYSEWNELIQSTIRG